MKINLEKIVKGFYFIFWVLMAFLGITIIGKSSSWGTAFGVSLYLLGISFSSFVFKQHYEYDIEKHKKEIEDLKKEIKNLTFTK